MFNGLEGDNVLLGSNMLAAMRLFVFSSASITNVWAGVGARLWAVKRPTTESVMKGFVTKAAGLTAGSAGVLYCSGTRSLTTPFLVYSRPDPARVVTDVWPESWVLPFAIHPLGTPMRQLPANEAINLLEVLRSDGRTNLSHLLPISAPTAFSPKDIPDTDWELILGALADA